MYLASSRKRALLPHADSVRFVHTTGIVFGTLRAILMRHVPDNSVWQVTFTKEQKMSRIVASSLIAAVAALFTVAQVAQAATEKAHNGKVVSVTEAKDSKDGKKDGQLVMTDMGGKKSHTHAVSANAKITLNKKTSTLGTLKKGDVVTVTTDNADKVTAIAAIRDAK